MVRPWDRKRVMSIDSQISPVSLGDLIVELLDQLPKILGTELGWIALNCVDLRSLGLNWCVEFACICVVWSCVDLGCREIDL
ncbi:unnamed protein product [Onchocerca ochengi]|uniref:Uncharacterized protein n=1 Tax=Onchocerca ochengi TaxID=42157 RepID=A0A182EU97_ONCOC|nr:unnamed protein product [Onchocerca ochengi]